MLAAHAQRLEEPTHCRRPTHGCRKPVLAAQDLDAVYESLHSARVPVCCCGDFAVLWAAPVPALSGIPQQRTPCAEQAVVQKRCCRSTGPAGGQVARVWDRMRIPSSPSVRGRGPLSHDVGRGQRGAVVLRCVIRAAGHRAPAAHEWCACVSLYELQRRRVFFAAIHAPGLERAVRAQRDAFPRGKAGVKRCQKK